METRNDGTGRFIVFEGLSGSGKTTQACLLVDFLKSLNIPVLFNDEPTKKSVFGRVIRDLIEKREIGGEVIDELTEAVNGCVDEVISREKYATPDVLMIADDFFRIVKRACSDIVVGAELDESQRQSLYVVDRYYDLKDTIIPSLEKGICVVQDRFDWSTYAYGSANGLLLKTIYRWHLVILGPIYIRPDCLFFFDVDSRTAMTRLIKSGKVLDVYETLDGLKKIYLQYNFTRTFLTRPLHDSEDYNIESVSWRNVAPRRIMVLDGNLSEDEIFAKIRDVCAEFFDI